MTAEKRRRWGCCGGSVARAVAHGAVGLGKAALRVGRAKDDVIARRRAVCRTCEHIERRPHRGALIPTTMSRCALCGCFVMPKATLADEKCPVGKW